jgi:hypothetical protein
MHFRYRDLGKFNQRKNHAVKFLKHRLNFVRRVHGHVNAGRKAAFASADYHNGDFPVLFQLLQRRQQLIHHLKVDHIERRMVQRDAGKRPVDIESDTIHGFFLQPRTRRCCA